MDVDPKTHELISQALAERGAAITEQERLLGIVGQIAHVVAEAPDAPAIDEIRRLVNEAMGRQLFPPGYTSAP